MKRKGLKIRRSLKTLMIGRLTFVKVASIRDVTTIKQSS